MPVITDASTCAKYGGKMVDGQCVITSANGQATMSLEQVTKMEAADEIIKSGNFMPFTNYLEVQPNDYGLKQPTGIGVLNLSAMLNFEELKTVKLSLVNVPLKQLPKFFVEKIWSKVPKEKQLEVPQGATPPTMPKGTAVKLTPAPKQEILVNGVSVPVNTSFRDVLWGGILELFNEVNLEYTLDNGISPSEWEETKDNSYLISQNPQVKKDIETTIAKSIDVSKDPKAIPILESYTRLPKLGDEGLEINRQAAIRELLLKGEYETAQAIINVYLYALQAGFGPAMAKPLPFEIKK